MAKSTGLGKGLGALIGNPKLAQAAPDTARGERVEDLPVSEIAPSPLQPRKTFDDAKLSELTESIRARGIMQPLIVRRGGDGKCELIAGERRWRAAQAAGLGTVPVIIRQASDQDVLELALIENLQRADLDPIEEAEGYQHLMKRFDLTQEQVSEVVGKKRATVANAVRLLALPEGIRTWLKTGRLSAGHGKAILSLRGGEEQTHVATKVLKDNLTVRATERLVEDIQQRSGTKSTSKKASGKSSGGGGAVMSDLEKRIQRALGTRVKVHGDGEAGRIEIQYYTSDELNRLIDQFGVEGY